MCTLFVRFGEECSNIAQEIASVIENVTNFSDSCNPLTPKGLWGGIFFELADNELSGCTTVIGANSRKWGRFGDASCAAQCALGWLVGRVRKLLTDLRLP